MTETQLPPSTNGSDPSPGRTHWRSLGHLEQSDAFLDTLHREFPEGAAEHSGLTDPVSRRKFLGVVAASVALAGMTGCRKPGRKIVPYTNRPEGITPGIPNVYATVQDRFGYGVGVLARSNDGRPTKLEGNPGHPGSLGGLDVFGQGELLNMYDPSRSHYVLHDGHASEKHDDHGHGGDDHGDAAHGDHGHDDHGHAPKRYKVEDVVSAWIDKAQVVAGKNEGAGAAFVIAPTASPTIERLLGEVKTALPKARIVRWSALHRDSELAGAEMALGRAVDTQFDFAQADRIASFDSDFLNTEQASLAWTRGYAEGRKVRVAGDEPSRLYAFETGYSVTGSNADHRWRMTYDQVGAALCALATAMGVGGSSVKSRGETLPQAVRDKIAKVSADLTAQNGRACVVVGRRQPAAIHALGHAINAKLGAVRATASETTKPVWYTATPTHQNARSVQELSDLTAAMKSGEVEMVACLGTNPVYDAPADLGFAAAYENVGLTVHAGLLIDETAQKSSWHVPMTHDLEEWADTRAFDGTMAVRQPLIAPLYDNARSLSTLIAAMVQLDETADDELVRGTMKGQLSGDFESAWEKVLHDGVVAGTAAGALGTMSVAAGAIDAAVGGLATMPQPTAQSIELHFTADPTILDGRYSNNPWMQEAPNPIDKLSWDNALLVSRGTADALKIENSDLVKVQVGGQSIEAAVWIQPGSAEFTATLTLGYGRDIIDGRLVDDDKNNRAEVCAEAGFHTGPLRTAAGQWVVSGAQVSKVGRYALVTTQDHGVMEGRPIAREGDLATFKENPSFAPDMSPLARAAALKGATEQEKLKSLWTERDYTKGHQWGMVIDMNSCTGCGACVVACQAENNIPVVGKDQVAVGREMHWNRMDRYFSSPAEYTEERVEASQDGVPLAQFDDDVQVVHQMIPCMQCENAPCEAVCPVAASMHSPDGLNDMVYNRCIGTRYCANNCPYKVRRFNWFDFHGEIPAQKQLAFNPDVTIRHRGVMEKCTYCVQRINKAKFSAKLEGSRKIADGAIQTACEQSCPADAITFGDVNDKDTRIAKLRGKWDYEKDAWATEPSPLNYAILSEYNNKPRTTYLAKVRNPNTELS